MQIQLNGEERALPEAITVQQLLVQLDQTGPGVAVAVNFQVVSKDQRDQRQLQDGDRVDLVTAVGGG